jgi:hypothetical protein
MDNIHPEARPMTRLAPTDLSDSLDIRLLVSGQLTPTAIPLRHDRAGLVAVLGRSAQARSAKPRSAHSERNAR